MSVVRNQSKVRLRKTDDAQIQWQTYTSGKGWVTHGNVQNAMLNRCQFHGDYSPDDTLKFVFCDTFYPVSAPMTKTVSLFGSPIRSTPQSFECDGIPIKKCDQAILLEGRFYKIA